MRYFNNYSYICFKRSVYGPQNFKEERFIHVYVPSANWIILLKWIENLEKFIELVCCNQIAVYLNDKREFRYWQSVLFAFSHWKPIYSRGLKEALMVEIWKYLVEESSWILFFTWLNSDEREVCILAVFIFLPWVFKYFLRMSLVNFFESKILLLFYNCAIL